MPWSLPITADGAVKQKRVRNPEDSKKPEPGKQLPGLFSYRAASGHGSIEFGHSKGGVSIGGASLWALNNEDEVKEAAAEMAFQNFRKKLFSISEKRNIIYAKHTNYKYFAR